MASIVGALIDKRGNTQPDVLLIAIIASNPAGDIGSIIIINSIQKNNLIW